MASSAEPSAAAQQYELERLMASHELDIVALQAAGLVVHEVFENERWSPVLKTWGSSYPGHLQPADPMPFTNRLQQSSGCRTKQEVKPPEGWEFLGTWQLDTTHTECDEEHGWSYALDFAQLRLLLLE